MPIGSLIPNDRQKNGTGSAAMTKVAGLSIFNACTDAPASPIGICLKDPSVAVPSAPYRSPNETTNYRSPWNYHGP